MHVVIFEGSDWAALAPLSLSRPTFMLHSGMSTLLEKQIRSLAPTRLTLWVRDELADYCRQVVAPLIASPTLTAPVRVNEPLDAEPALIESGRVLHFNRFETPYAPCVSLDEETQFVHQAYISSPGLTYDDVLTRSPRWLALKELPQTLPQARFARYVWDLLNWNDESLIADSMYQRGQSLNVKDLPELNSGPWHLINSDDILLSPGVKLGPGCVIDASNGPIALGQSVTIGANAVIQGPCYIGDFSEIVALGHIRPGTSIGPGCKIGGEVSNSIVIGHSNKSHYGYLGDSYLGEWVNLGAGTTTSNLKNTYSTITLPMGPKEIDTGRRFLGSVIGDHVKTAIGTRLMSGTYLGYNSMLAASAIPARFVPSFTFQTDRGTEPYRMDKALEVAQAVFARRNRQWTDADESHMRAVAATAKQVEARA